MGSAEWDALAGVVQHARSLNCVGTKYVASLDTMSAARVIPIWLVMTVLACIAAATYFNTLHAGFTYDDFYAVVIFCHRHVFDELRVSQHEFTYSLHDKCANIL